MDSVNAHQSSSSLIFAGIEVIYLKIAHLLTQSQARAKGNLFLKINCNFTKT